VSGIKAALTIAKKDIRSQMRKKFEIFAMFLFSMVSVLAFALASEGDVAPDAASGFLWVIIFLTGMFGFSPVFLSEVESGTLRGLALTPTPAWSVYIGKVIYGFLLMGLVEVFLVPISLVLMNFTFAGDLALVALVLIIGTLDLAAVGSMASALTMPAESKATIYPLVYFPPAITALILLLQITRALAVGAVLLTMGFLFQLLLAHLIAMLTLSGAVFHFALTN
jgi:heme exporter protein CcmB